MLEKIDREPIYYIHHLCKIKNQSELTSEIQRIFDLCVKQIRSADSDVSVIDNIKVIYTIFDQFKKDMPAELYMDFFFTEEFYAISDDEGARSLINKVIIDVLKHASADIDLNIKSKVEFFLHRFIEKNDKISLCVLLQDFKVNNNSFSNIMKYISNFNDDRLAEFLRICKTLIYDNTDKKNIIHYLFDNNKVDYICALRDNDIIDAKFIEHNVISKNNNWSDYMTQKNMNSFFYYLYSSKSQEQISVNTEKIKIVDSIFFDSLKKRDLIMLEQLFNKFPHCISLKNEQTNRSYSVENIKNFLFSLLDDSRDNYIEVFKLLINNIDYYDKNFKNVMLNNLVIKYNSNRNNSKQYEQLIKELLLIDADVDISCGFQDNGMRLDAPNIIIYAIYNNCFDLATLLIRNHRLYFIENDVKNLDRNEAEKQYDDFLRENHILAIAYDRFLRELSKDNNEENQRKSAKLVRQILEKYGYRAFDISYSDGANVFNSIIKDNQLHTYLLENDKSNFIKDIIYHSMNDEKAFDHQIIEHRKHLMMSLAQAGHLDSINDIMARFPKFCTKALNYVNDNNENLSFLMIKFLISNNTQDNIDKFNIFFERNNILHTSSLNHIDSRQYNILHYAYMLGNQNIIDNLVNNSELRVSEKERLICLCEGGNNLDLIKKVDIDHLHKYINNKMRGDMTLLHFIIQSSGNAKKNIVKFLICNGANLNAKNVIGRTPLMSAVLSGDLDLVRQLLSQSSVDVNEVDVHGNTALHLAISQSTKDIVDALMNDIRVNVNKKNKDGILPISYAYCSYKTLISGNATQNTISAHAFNECDLTNIMTRLVEAGSDIPRKHRRRKFILSIIWSFIKSKILTTLNQKIIQKFTGNAAQNLVQIGIDVKQAFEVSKITTEFVQGVLQHNENGDFLKSMRHEMIANHNVTSFGNVYSNQMLLSKARIGIYNSHKDTGERNNYIFSLNIKRQYMNIKKHVDQMSVVSRSRRKLLHLLDNIKKIEHRENDCLSLYSKDQEISELLDYNHDKLVKYMIANVDNQKKNHFIELIDDIVAGEVNVSCETFYKAIKLVEAKEKILFHKKNKWFSYKQKLYSNDISEIEDYITKVDFIEIQKHKNVIQQEKSRAFELKCNKIINYNNKLNDNRWNDVLKSVKSIFAKGVGSAAGLCTLARNHPKDAISICNIASPVIQGIVTMATFNPSFSLCIVSSVLGIATLKNILTEDSQSNLFRDIERKQEEFISQKQNLILKKKVSEHDIAFYNFYNDRFLQYNVKPKNSLQDDAITQKIAQIKRILFSQKIDTTHIRDNQKKPLKKLLPPNIVQKISLGNLI